MDEIEKKMDNVTQKISTLHAIVKNETSESRLTKELNVGLMSIKRELLAIHGLILKENLPDSHRTSIRFKKITNMMKLFDDYSDDLALWRTHHNVNLLTIISIMSVPLTLITGYFGMNFIKMGPLYHIKNPHKFILLLTIIAIVLSIVLFHVWHSKTENEIEKIDL